MAQESCIAKLFKEPRQLQSDVNCPLVFLFGNPLVSVLDTFLRTRLSFELVKNRLTKTLIRQINSR